ncbi:unnamed protein product, partial [Phaeothamnion confervicola]
ERRRGEDSRERQERDRSRDRELGNGRTNGSHYERRDDRPDDASRQPRASRWGERAAEFDVRGATGNGHHSAIVPAAAPSGPSTFKIPPLPSEARMRQGGTYGPADREGGGSGGYGGGGGFGGGYGGGRGEGRGRVRDESFAQMRLEKRAAAPHVNVWARSPSPPTAAERGGKGKNDGAAAASKGAAAGKGRAKAAENGKV